MKIGRCWNNNSNLSRLGYSYVEIPLREIDNIKNCDLEIYSSNNFFPNNFSIFDKDVYKYAEIVLAKAKKLARQLKKVICPVICALISLRPSGAASGPSTCFWPK